MKKILLIFAVLFMASFATAGNLIIDSVNYTPAPAMPGEYFDIFVHLKNDSKFLAEGIEFELDLKGGNERDSDYPFSLGTGVSHLKKIASIQPRKTALMEYKIRVDPTALDGSYTIVYKFMEGTAHKEYKHTIQILSRKPELEIVSASETTAAPGQIVELVLGIRNIGNGFAKEILVGLEEDRTVTSTGIVVEREFASLGASFDFVSNLNPGDDAKAFISLAVNPNAEQKTYMVPIIIKYKDSNGTAYTETTYVGMKIGQEPEIDAVISEAEPAVFPGGKSDITIDLFNIGVGTAKYVVAELSTKAGKLDQEKVFIGTLEADDFDSFSVKLAVSPTVDPAKENWVNVKLVYKNQYGEQREVEKALLLKVGSVAEAIGGVNPLVAIVGLIGLVLQLVGLYWLGKKLYKRFIKKA